MPAENTDSLYKEFETIVELHRKLGPVDSFKVFEVLCDCIEKKIAEESIMIVRAILGKKSTSENEED